MPGVCVPLTRIAQADDQLNGLEGHASWVGNR
jgi:hypothetical protein